MQCESESAEPPQFPSAHPGSAQRIEDIRKAMPEALKYYEASSKH